MGKKRSGSDVRIKGLSAERIEQLDNCAAYSFIPRNSFLKKKLIELLDSTPDEIKNPKKDD